MNSSVFRGRKKGRQREKYTMILSKERSKKDMKIWGVNERSVKGREGMHGCKFREVLKRGCKGIHRSERIKLARKV
jgi:hypothetical protein